MEDTKQLTGYHIIAKFMGLEAVTIGYYGTDDETEFQVKYKDWLDKPEIVEQYDNSVGEYYVNIERNLIIPQDEINYHKSWDDLMPVWYKFRDLKFDDFAQTAFNNYCARIAHALAYEDIQNVHYKLTLGIKWYQEYTTNQPQKAS